MNLEERFLSIYSPPAVKDWEKEDRGPDFEAPLDSAMMTLDEALERFYTQCGIPPA